MSVAVKEERIQTNDVVTKWNQPRTRRWWPWFILGGALLFFSYGANNVPIAAWFAPAFLLYFVRSQKWHMWIPLVYGV